MYKIAEIEEQFIQLKATFDSQVYANQLTLDHYSTASKGGP